ncbi:MAG: 4'-phosphopantetheinyl transferase superfamily protein [Bacteroidota bacterium]
MPLIKTERIVPAGEWGIWKIEESEAFFLDALGLRSLEVQQLATMKGRRRVEWLASRYLLHVLSGREDRADCLKDEFGKPYLVGSDYQISLSHSHGLAAVIAAPQAVGIDIQLEVSKIERIAHKYMRPEEMSSLSTTRRITHLHVYWGAKEALFKAYGRKEVDFKQHLHMEPFSLQENGGNFQGKLIKPDTEQSFRLSYRLFDSFVLVWCIEQEGG